MLLTEENMHYGVGKPVCVDRGGMWYRNGPTHMNSSFDRDGEVINVGVLPGIGYTWVWIPNKLLNK